ncbi:MAG: DUF2240 family protein [Candidatus Aenigmarchaeota archaeon]|nr:DUF2240 family protein [Candidatus Aenigmarchaeota archaeon]
MIDNIIENIAKKAGIGKEEVREMVSEKYKELSEMISEEGAAYIVAKELGINKEKRGIKISDIKPNMRVEMAAKIIGENTRDFSTANGKGRVQNLILADDSGTVRMVLWNEEIDRYELKKNDVIMLRGYAKEDSKGGAELRLGKYGIMEKVDEDIPVVHSRGKYERNYIYGMKEGSGEIRAAVLHVFESKPFYQICPICGSGSKEGCPEHGNVEPADALVINAIVDDGTGSIRAVFFRDNAEKLIGHDVKKAKELFIHGLLFKNMPIGKEFILRGKCRSNKLYGRNEFVVGSIEEVDIKEEIRALL